MGVINHSLIGRGEEKMIKDYCISSSIYCFLSYGWLIMFIETAEIQILVGF